MKNLIPPFNADRQLKSTLSSTMWADSNDFLKRVNLLMADLDLWSTSYLSKIYVDILMSIESSLKALIIALSDKKETPEDAYRTARSKSHRIDQLYAEVERRAFRRIKLLNQKDKDELLNNAIKIKVSNRYRLVTLAQIRSDGIAIHWGGGQYSNLINYDYLLKLSEIAFKLKSISLTGNKRYMDRQGMNGVNLGKYDQRFQDFHTNLRGRI